MVCDHHSSISKSPQVFGGVKGKAPEISDFPSPSAFRMMGFVFSSQSLSSILNDKKPSLLSYFKKRVHINALSEEMDGDDGFRSRGDLLFNLRGIDIIGVRIDIDKDRGCTYARDSSSCGKKSEGRDEDFVSGSNPESH